MKDKWNLRFEEWLLSAGFPYPQTDKSGQLYLNPIMRLCFEAWKRGLDDGVDDAWMFSVKKDEDEK